MPELAEPTTAVHASFLAAMQEFAAEGRGTPQDNTMIGRDIAAWGRGWADPEVFARYVRDLLAEAREDLPRPPGLVACTTRWYVEGAEYLGRIALRHEYTPYLRVYGGIIGYDVRPSARRRGHATAMLPAVLPLAAGLGFTSVLVTCDHDNTASRKVIEAAGGVYENRRGAKLRYWVPTGA
jgi:predicted acetyltransferase